MNRRTAARAAAKESGRTPRDQHPKPEVPRGAGDRILKTREANRKQLAETEKRDAAT